MTENLLIENLLNQLLGKCSTEVERRARLGGGMANSAQIAFERNRCVRTLFPQNLPARSALKSASQKGTSLKNQGPFVPSRRVHSCTWALREVH